MSLSIPRALKKNIRVSSIQLQQYTYHATTFDWKLCGAQLAMASRAGETTALVPVGREECVFGVIMLAR